jgi:hypothetical protein
MVGLAEPPQPLDDGGGVQLRAQWGTNNLVDETATVWELSRETCPWRLSHISSCDSGARGCEVGVMAYDVLLANRTDPLKRSSLFLLPLSVAGKDKR